MTVNPCVDAHRKRLKGRPKGGEVYVVGYSIISGSGFSVFGLIRLR